ncbi:MAG: SDR family oxidoreductase [Cyanobacteria bacterium REEB67]|nr:SDR family oxidoreductase [Cyanobacteria bacterium REEB67]
MQDWSTKNMPTQWGKLAVVTGATGGLGYDTALALTVAGAEVIVAGRNAKKGEAAVKKIMAHEPTGTARFELLDLADLKQIDAFCKKLIAEDRPVDILVNNAGVMALPTRQETVDGFEMQIGTNHLGHFALTAGLLPLLIRGREPRVVNVSSIAHRPGKINFDDLQSKKHYGPATAYMQSKLANMLFTLELQKRSDANGWGLMAVGAHPGYSRTDLIANGPDLHGQAPAFLKLLKQLMEPACSQSSAQGALPQLFAATSPEAKKNGYYGPNGFLEMKGYPALAVVARQAKDEKGAAKLWEVSEQLTGAVWQATSKTETGTGSRKV